MSNRKLRNDLDALKELVEQLRKELAEKTATPAPIIHYHPPARIIYPHIPQPNPFSPGNPWQDTIITCLSPIGTGPAPGHDYTHFWTVQNPKQF